MKRPVIRMIPTSALFVDDRYQRLIEMNRVRKIVRDFEEDLFGVLEVNRRGTNGKYAIIDGQHRHKAAEILGIEEVPCTIRENMSAQKEASLFTKIQTSRKGLNQVDRFMAQVFAEDHDSVDIYNIVNSLDLTIDRSRHSSTTISAVISLERIYNRWGGQHLKYTLTESKAIWGGEDGSLQGAFLDGFARFLAAYGDTRYTDLVKERLGLVMPTTLMRRASAIRGGGSQMGVLIYTQLRRAAGVRGAPRRKM